ncbi:(2Fe-2S)-binding protein [Marinifilum caeruleilacunae]|uniref:(2Fe-2S)-binding protein n=1 Tax=Marinifilum caeruleilacunae TaxID=2499076 RepID=UPI0032119C05
MIGKILCSCNQVGEGNIENLIGSGVKDLDEICEKSNAGLGCGSCRPEIQKILNDQLKNEQYEKVK